MATLPSLTPDLVHKAVEQLGIDAGEQKHLLGVARTFAELPLPAGWFRSLEEGSGAIVYTDSSGQASTEHPQLAQFKLLLAKLAVDAAPEVPTTRMAFTQPDGTPYVHDFSTGAAAEGEAEGDMGLIPALPAELLQEFGINTTEHVPAGAAAASAAEHAAAEKEAEAPVREANELGAPADEPATAPAGGVAADPAEGAVESARVAGAADAAGDETAAAADAVEARGEEQEAAAAAEAPTAAMEGAGAEGGAKAEATKATEGGDDDGVWADRDEGEGGTAPAAAEEQGKPAGEREAAGDEAPAEAAAGAAEAGFDEAADAPAAPAAQASEAFPPAPDGAAVSRTMSTASATSSAASRAASSKLAPATSASRPGSGLAPAASTSRPASSTLAPAASASHPGSSTLAPAASTSLSGSSSVTSAAPASRAASSSLAPAASASRPGSSAAPAPAAAASPPPASASTSRPASSGAPAVAATSRPASGASAPVAAGRPASGTSAASTAAPPPAPTSRPASLKAPAAAAAASRPASGGPAAAAAAASPAAVSRPASSGRPAVDGDAAAAPASPPAAAPAAAAPPPKSAGSLAATGSRVPKLRYFSWWYEDIESTDLTFRINSDSIAGGGLRKRYVLLEYDIVAMAFNLRSESDDQELRLNGVPVLTKGGTPAEVWDLHVGATFRVMGKPLSLHKADLESAKWNDQHGQRLRQLKSELLAELQKYKPRAHSNALTFERGDKVNAGGYDLRHMIEQINSLLSDLQQYRPAKVEAFRSRVSIQL